jgi:glycosyltransferase involved in cell wall biosynthesis
MITYNHERFIREALDGILNQKVNFDLEIIVGEDCSSDNTREILLEYKNKYPNLFQLLLHSPNVGAKQNHILTQSACKGKYIAFCEGDDYWTEPNKLQKQVDFLEKNEEYSHCWTRFQKVHEKSQYLIKCDDSNGVYFKQDDEGIDFDYEKFYKGWEIGMQTLVFRNKSFDISLAYKYNYFKDTHLISHLLLNGKGYCLSSFGAIYRLHGNGQNTSLSNLQLAKVGYYTYLELYVKIRKEEFLMKKYNLYTKNYINLLIENNLKFKAIPIICQNFYYVKNIKITRDFIYLFKKSFFR